MNKTEIEQIKKRLLAEKAQLETELDGVGQKETGNSGNWKVTTSDIEVDSADENEVADKLEEYEGNSGILQQLEEQLADVNSALDRIEKGTYGICEICGKQIEQDRLVANPSARTSIKHGHPQTAKK